MTVSGSLYQTLQVDPRAESVVIQAAYRALMKRYHPDRGGSAVVAQRLNAAYSTLGNPSTRRAYDLLRARPLVDRVLDAAPPPGPDRDAASAPSTPGVAAGGGALVARLGTSLAERFLPAERQGPTWLFDFAGRPVEASRERILVKGFERGDAADAQSFRMRIEAARLLEPIWRRGLDLFVAVLPHTSDRFTALLRAPSRTLARLSYAVAVVDLSTRTVHAVGSTGDLRALAALTAVVGRPLAASA